MLSKRLQAVLSFLNTQDKIADIGTDHGQLLVGCLEKGIKVVQGIDNKEGPLKNAIKNLQPYFELYEVTCTLGEGLTLLEEGIDTVTICGMGGELISSILASEIEKAKTLKKLILQPNLRITELRMFLNGEHFQIDEEIIVEERGKFYEIIVCHFEQNAPKLSKYEKYFGPCLLKEKPPLFYQKYQERLAKYERIIAQNTADPAVISEIIEEKKMIEEVLYD